MVALVKSGAALEDSLCFSLQVGPVVDAIGKLSDLVVLVTIVNTAAHACLV